MDLYLLYNCVNNISEIIETPEKKISLRHELMINDPLIHKFYLDNLYKIPKSINSSSYIGGSGLMKAMKAMEAMKEMKAMKAMGPVLKKTNVANIVQNPPVAQAGKKPQAGTVAKKPQAGTKEEDKKKEDKKKEEDKQAKSSAEAEEDKALEEEVEKASAGSENVGELDGLKKFLKKFSKLIIGLLVILIMPLAPWVLITIYSFKNLATFFEINTNRL